MTNERFIPNDSTHDVVTFEILSDGKSIPQEYGVISIVVTKEINRIPTAKIVIRDGDASAEDFEVSNAKEFTPGAQIEIKVGRDALDKTVFKGIVVRHGIKVTGAGECVLRVECKDEAVKMTVGRKSRLFLKTKDSEVMQQLAKEAGLKVAIAATSVQHEELVQHHATDWDFLVSRAEVNGMLVMADDGELAVKKPDTSATPAVSLVYGSTIFEFEAEMDARNQWASVTGEAWDYSQQKLVEASAKSAPVAEPGNIKGADLAKVTGLKEFKLSHGGQVLDPELKVWTESCMLKSRLTKIVGRARFLGFREVKPGKMVGLDGVGDRFNGNAFISGVRHEIVGGAWYTHAQFGLPADWFHHKEHIIETPAAGLLPAIHGLQIGKVEQLEKDPAEENRIRVSLPILGKQKEGVWVRTAHLDAGKERGTYWLPEIQDEVVVGFINGDPRDGILLGMLHSKKLPAPLKAEDTNHHKGIVTRSKMKVLFDDEKKIVTIETPAGNSIVITEKDKSIILTDQNKNKIEMEPAGIDVISPKDIKIDAKGAISIKAGKDVSVQAAKDVSIKGLNVKAKADAQMEASGNAGAKFTSSAIAELKGSLVKIN